MLLPLHTRRRGSAHLSSSAPIQKGIGMRRTMLLLTVMAATLVMASGVALAQPRGGSDLCVSHEGETIYNQGTSDCLSDPTSTAVAINSFADASNDSVAVGINSFVGANIDSVAVGIDDSFATAQNDGVAVGIDHSVAQAIDHSVALAFDACDVRAVNGEVETCR
jgi:hypothetical protein